MEEAAAIAVANIRFVYDVECFIPQTYAQILLLKFNVMPNADAERAT